jgi:protein TonB
VAIVREIAMQLHRGGEPYHVPALTDIAVLTSGDVMLSGGRPHPAGAVAGVGIIMSQLLEPVGSPQQVLDIQRQALTAPPTFANLFAFHNALDFFARPDAKGVLADFYTRASAALELGSKNRELDALKEKSKTKRPPDSDEKGRRGKRPVWVIAAAAVLVAAFAGAAVYLWRGGSGESAVVSQSANAALAAISDTGKKVQDATTNVISKLVGGATEAAPAEPAPATNVSPAAPLPVPRRRAAPSTSAPTTPAAPPRAASAPAPAPAAPPPPPPVEAPADLPPIDTNVYTAQSADVVAPELVYPQLPTRRSEDPPPPGEPGELDMLVLEDGTVGEARLVPMSNRLQDRMMVSAAKAWRFRPAQKDGRPVRYRVRIPITW